ncbi:MAG: NUDIX hydrolase [Candidatus Tokpelaia hoelldobleri]|uniref:NUDIX hydrolase n=1 Tax=Candidatus Tokpelaia hoelldobleri TaxID=1902579 RepID=A0A1U9JTX5_9HYPH|nr:MAG: NUDIX hydrolase [Candidatus Tokpelaia hoelldoblerii]
MIPPSTTLMEKKKNRLDDGRYLQVAALAYRVEHDDLQVLLVTSRRTRRWVLPKGWPIPGKTLPEAAKQEAWEEAGIKGHIQPEPVGCYFYQKNDMGKNKDKTGLFRVAVYALAFSHQEKNWPECKERSLEWVSPEIAAARVREPDLQKLLAAFPAYIAHKNP